MGPQLFPQPRSSARAGRLRTRRRSQRGFTLVELMVAMTGGLFLSMVVLALSRDAARFYQRETRVANATLAGLSGFERLSNDVARAGHLSTPNIEQDPRVCNVPDASWPAMLRKLRAVVVETDMTPLNNTEVKSAGFTPQGIVLTGAMNTIEQLYANDITQGADGSWLVYVNLGVPSAARVGLSPTPTAAVTAANQAALERIFLSQGVGHAIRLRKGGKDQYGVVKEVKAISGQAYLTLLPTPQLVKQKSGTICGIDSHSNGTAISVIDIVRYNLRRMLDDPAYTSLFKASGVGTGGGAGASPWDGRRAELVRVELTPDGQEIDATREIVAEYAVDLQFAGWGATSATNSTITAVNAALTNAYTGTQLLRGLHVRLSVRSREPEYSCDVTGVPLGANDHYRIALGLDSELVKNRGYLGQGFNGKDTNEECVGSPFARVRTLQSDIALRNLENSNW